MSISIDKNKILVITGPTASGKSSLAIELAREYDGEIISADSRQIYRGMDIGTGKVERDPNPVGAIPRGCPGDVYISEGVIHHLIDIREPNEDYNVTDFKRDAEELIQGIRSRGKLPIICGGTSFWIQALVDDQAFPAVPPNPKLREELSHVSCEELFERLKTLDPERAETIDSKNSFRLIRAIEIIEAIGKVPATQKNAQSEKYQIIAINPPKEILDAKIKKRLDERFDQSMIEEVQNLHNEGISWERLEAFGLEYRWIALFLQEKITETEMREKLYFDIVHYAKRQRTWLRRWEKQGADIQWV